MPRPGKWRLGTRPCCPNSAYPVASHVKPRIISRKTTAPRPTLPRPLWQTPEGRAGLSADSGPSLRVSDQTSRLEIPTALPLPIGNLACSPAKRLKGPHQVPSLGCWHGSQESLDLFATTLRDVVDEPIAGSSQVEPDFAPITTCSSTRNEPLSNESIAEAGCRRGIHAQRDLRGRPVAGVRGIRGRQGHGTAAAKPLPRGLRVSEPPPTRGHGWRS